MQGITHPSHCEACRLLHDECGELFGHYSRCLARRGWAGVLSATERAWVRAHRTEAQQRAATAFRQRVQNRNAGSKTLVQTGMRLADGSLCGVAS